MNYKRLYIGCLLILRAFDSLDHARMWNILERYGTPAKILTIIRNLYLHDVTCKISHNSEVCHNINVMSGVKQGCFLSPLLFILIIDWVMRKLQNHLEELIEP
jgi:hypothetical protein